MSWTCLKWIQTSARRETWTIMSTISMSPPVFGWLYKSPITYIAHISFHSMSGSDSIKSPSWNPQLDWTWHGRCPGSPRTQGMGGIHHRALNMRDVEPVRLTLRWRLGLPSLKTWDTSKWGIFGAVFVAICRRYHRSMACTDFGYLDSPINVSWLGVLWTKTALSNPLTFWSDCGTVEVWS